MFVEDFFSFLKERADAGQLFTGATYNPETKEITLSGGGLASVSTDATLTGDGTSEDPLSVVGGGGTTKGIFTGTTSNFQSNTFQPVTGTNGNVVSGGSAIDYKSTVVPFAITLKNIYLIGDATEGDGESEVFKVYVNGSASALGVTITTGAHSGNASADVSVAAGSYLALFYDPTSTGNFSGVTFAIGYEFQ